MVAALLLLLPTPALASTQILASPRVRVLADQEQQGPSEGFLTLRVQAENLTGRGQRVRVRFESRPSAEVAATLDLAPAERRSVDLLIPAHARYGTLFADDGHDRGSEGFNWHWQSHDPMLVEGPTAAADLVARGKSPDGSPTSFPAAVAVPKERLPTALASLVGYTAVGVLETPFEELAEPQRRALEAYAATGGELFLAQVPARPEALLPLWRGPRAEGPRPYGLGHVHLYSNARRCVDALYGVGDLRRPAAAAGPNSFGRGYGGTPSDPLIAVARVPVGGFLLLVLLFVFVIGPGSFAVRTRKGPVALVLFIPLTALATCGGIAGYGVLHEGLFTIHAASRTVTFLDAERHRAATLSVDGFYASLAPSVVRYGALATPIPPQNVAGGEGLQIDLTDGLALEGGFIPSRTYREHLNASVAPSRARLSARSAGPGQVTVENALGAKVVDGAVKIEGKVCLFYGLADGASGSASCVEDAALPGVFRSRVHARLVDRFVADRLDETALAPLEDGAFLVSLDRAVFAPDLGLSLRREGDTQLVRGRVSP